MWLPDPQSPFFLCVRTLTPETVLVLTLTPESVLVLTLILDSVLVVTLTPESVFVIMLIPACVPEAVLKRKANALHAWGDSWQIERNFWGTFMNEEAAHTVLLDKCMGR